MPLGRGNLKSTGSEYTNMSCSTVGIWEFSFGLFSYNESHILTFGCLIFLSCKNHKHTKTLKEIDSLEDLMNPSNISWYVIMNSSLLHVSLLKIKTKNLPLSVQMNFQDKMIAFGWKEWFDLWRNCLSFFFLQHFGFK